MPLLDHFHPPLSVARHWESLHARWAGAIADALNNNVLPRGYYAEEQIPAIFPDSLEIQVINTKGGPNLVASVELISPGNKDRPEFRRAFAVKCASYLQQGISLIIVDIVTSRLANLHNELVELLDVGESFRMPSEPLYAVAYRPVRRPTVEQIETWPTVLHLGQSLPTLPLALDKAISVPLDLEGTYAEACQRRRLA